MDHCGHLMRQKVEKRICVAILQPADGEVHAEFNNTSRCYEIKATLPYKRYDQVFICYGPHDNHRLLLEYGFVSSNNPHSVVYIEKDVIFACLSKKDKQIAQKMSILKEHGFLENLTFDFDGPSWRLFTALKLLCLEPEEFNLWKNVLHGASVSEGNEKKRLELAKRICLHLIHENQEAMQKVSVLKKARSELQEHLHMVEALRLEELRILQASAEVLANLTSVVSSMT
ncbi:SET domain-containing protein 4-like [Protopterus annectens]|uniref:SET domain-containing protein 4-like n=1 Tax=Protopterus annectens TaxID=7888 RepID=UPI001CF943DA|nr:SET domain-containing protein 4-like [Protopterus annectens]